MDIESSQKLIQDLSCSEIYKEYEHAFQEATQLPLSLCSLDEAGNVENTYNQTEENQFCIYLKRNNVVCQECNAIINNLLTMSQSKGKTQTSTCFAGLSDSVVPLFMGNDIVGYLQTGQIILSDDSDNKEVSLEKYRLKLKKLGVNIDDDEKLADLYKNSRVVSHSQYEAILKLLEIFASQLSSVLAEKVIQQNEGEPPRIRKAKRYIQEHIDQDITLSDVASFVNWSAYYFSRMFKKATGFNFVDYLARARIERAKHMLLNPHLNVSEIAYEVGFQSITHFNRVFRKLTGNSPTDFRKEHLAA